ncbi:hypothetical protein DNTS_027560, partial [Danionella cerebrum]
MNAAAGSPPYGVLSVSLRFEGDVEGEVFHGEGVAYFRDGHVYKGSFFHGLLHGFGEYIWSDGLKYQLVIITDEDGAENKDRHQKELQNVQGEFKMNVPMGTGTYTWLDGSTYEGEVKQGLRHGFGTHKCAKTLAVYRGQWYLGKRQGKGLMHYNQEGTTWYEGEWLNNCREGWGKHHYPSGNVYEGEWRNNIRHGEGTMRWIDLDEQYSGQWVNGVQEGRGTHTWLRKRAPCSLYPRMNEYIGEVFQRMRHGRGDFFYASGAVYSGEWNHDRKHGQGRYVFEDGRVYEGEFIKDSIAEFPAFTPGLSGITSPFPDENFGSSNFFSLNFGNSGEASKTRSSFSPLGSDIILNIQTLLTRVPENRRDQELKQVEFAVLRHIGLLREIYSFYSNLGHEEHPERTYPMTLLQFSRFLLDCRVHQCGITLAHMLRLVTAEEACSPSTVILPRECISLIISVAYHIFHKDTESTKIISECFSKLMMQNIVPNAKNVKGYLFHHADVGSIYSERCWEIYQILSKAHSVKSVACITVRQFILMLQDLCLYDEYLTVSKVLKILSQESPAVSDGTYSNLDLEVS